MRDRPIPSAVTAVLALVLTTGLVPLSASLAPAHAGQVGPPIQPAPVPTEEPPRVPTGLITDADPAPTKHPLTRALDVAAAASSWQAARLDQPLAQEPAGEPPTPSAAFLELADRFDVTLTPEDRDALEALDRSGGPVADALADLAVAFLGLETAATLAYQDAEAGPPTPLAATAAIDDVPSPGDRLAEDGVELGPVFAARLHVLDAIQRLHGALEAAPTDEEGACERVQVPPAFGLSLGSCDDHYVEDYALLVDTGGSDTYRNNAGGSNLAAIEGACFLGQRSGTATLVDLGTEDDRFGDPEDPRGCGANGGGGGGVGLLVAEGGDNTYVAGHTAVNGGSFYRGMGLLVDAGGSDAYEGGILGANGGTYGPSSGLLVDGSGDDVYEATWAGANGGGDGGVGTLIDLGGDDRYRALFESTNGGAAVGGTGLLLDATGDDNYTAESLAVNGGAFLAGDGFLLDEAGDDVYRAEDRAVNGGGTLGGSGTLVDRGGGDRYVAAGACGTNGGGATEDCMDRTASLPGSTCTLLGLEEPCEIAVRVPGETRGGSGVLWDGGGQDTYEDEDLTCEDCSSMPKGGVGAQIDHG